MTPSPCATAQFITSTSWLCFQLSQQSRPQTWMILPKVIISMFNINIFAVEIVSVLPSLYNVSYVSFPNTLNT